MITDCFDNKTEPIISLKNFYGEQKHILDTCLIIFSSEIYHHLLKTYKPEMIASINGCNGKTPIYKMSFNGKDIAFYLTAIGSALAAEMCYETHWLTGATKFIMFGSCGSLNKEETAGKYIIPTESYRGEGASYYFKAPADYIKIKNCHKLAAIFNVLKVPYVLGKIWTTDSMIRETKGLVSKRKEEGCIAVEMEVAGVQAVCDFYGLELYDFLEAGDVLDAETYKHEGLNDANHNLDKLFIALSIALLI